MSDERRINMVAPTVDLKRAATIMAERNGTTLTGWTMRLWLESMDPDVIRALRKGAYAPDPGQ